MLDHEPVKIGDVLGTTDKSHDLFPSNRHERERVPGSQDRLVQMTDAPGPREPRKLAEIPLICRLANAAMWAFETGSIRTGESSPAHPVAVRPVVPPSFRQDRAMASCRRMADSLTPN